MDLNLQSGKPITENNPPPKNNSRRFLFMYSFILFFVAFLLILFSYFTQARNNEIELENIKQEHNLIALNAKSSITNLQEQNENLRKELSLANDELADLRAGFESASAVAGGLTLGNQYLSGLLSAHDAAINSISRQNLSLMYFIDLQSSFNAKKYNRCLSLISEIEESGLDRYLPDANADIDGLTPGDTPAELYGYYKKQLRR